MVPPEYFGIEPVGLQKPPINLTEEMVALEHKWPEMVDECRLKKYASTEIATWLLN